MSSSFSNTRPYYRAARSSDARNLAPCFATRMHQQRWTLFVFPSAGYLLFTLLTEERGGNKTEKGSVDAAGHNLRDRWGVVFLFFSSCVKWAPMCTSAETSGGRVKVHHHTMTRRGEEHGALSSIPQHPPRPQRRRIPRPPPRSPSREPPSPREPRRTRPPPFLHRRTNEQMRACCT